MNTTAERTAQIQVLREFPAKLEALVAGLTPEQLTTPYNAPEWTVAQNVHHLVDSHINSYIRFKLVMTEENPPLKPYKQAEWAELADANTPDISTSLAILRGLHARWVIFIESITDFERSGNHPENGRMTLGSMVATYANHCNAHIKQIQEVLDKMPK
jgi:hypothetical protein